MIRTTNRITPPLSDFLRLLKRMASAAIVQDITVNSDGDAVHHTRHIDVDRFIEAIDAELENL